MLPRGGEGSWDSHWVVPTLCPPVARGERLYVVYYGTSTKHASGPLHRRGSGLASIRRDGWVSLEAGRTEGVVVTKKLPLQKPMKLALNVNCHSGYVAVDVIAPSSLFDPIKGYGADASRVEHVDLISHRVTWKRKRVVKPIPGGKCFLRFTMRQGSLFSYRWSEA